MRETRSTPGLGETIRRLREEHGWTQGDLAALAGVTQAQVSRLESGDQDDPRTSTLVGLADAFGLSLDALTGRRTRRPGRPQAGVLSSTDYTKLKTAAGARVEAHLAGALAS